MTTYITTWNKQWQHFQMLCMHALRSHKYLKHLFGFCFSLFDPLSHAPCLACCLLSRIMCVWLFFSVLIPWTTSLLWFGGISLSLFIFLYFCLSVLCHTVLYSDRTHWLSSYFHYLHAFFSYVFHISRGWNICLSLCSYFYTFFLYMIFSIIYSLSLMIV